MSVEVSAEPCKFAPPPPVAVVKCCRCEACDGMFLWTCNRCGKVYCGVWGANHAADPLAHPCVALTSSAPLRFTNVSTPTDPLATITLSRLVERWQSCLSPSSVDEAAKLLEDCTGCNPATRMAIMTYLTKKQPALYNRILCPWTKIITMGTATVTTETGADGGKATVSWADDEAIPANTSSVVVTGVPDISSVSGCCFNVHATLSAPPRDGKFQVRTVDNDDVPTKGEVGWVAVHRDGTRMHSSVLTSGVFSIEGNVPERAITVQFARPFARPPVVLLSVAGGSVRASAMVVGTPTTQSFACCVNDASTGQQSGGSVHWIAIDTQGFHANYANHIRCGTVCTETGKDCVISLPRQAQPSEVPVVILTAKGKVPTEHITAVLRTKPTARDFTCRLVGTRSTVAAGAIYWAAFTQHAAWNAE